MTKQEALRKIEELKQFVVELDSKEKELEHGDLVLSPFGNIRIVIATKDIKEGDLDFRYLVFGDNRRVSNSFDALSDAGATYTKIGNVFDGK